MNPIKVSFLTLTSLVLTLAFSSHAWAAKSFEELVKLGGDAILQEADDRANPADDVTRSVKMILRGGGDDDPRLCDRLSALKPSWSCVIGGDGRRGIASVAVCKNPQIGGADVNIHGRIP